MRGIKKHFGAFPKIMIYILSAASLAVIAFIFIFIFYKAFPVIFASGVSLFTTGGFDEQINAAYYSSEADPMVGTFILTVTGIIIAFPFALATSVYLTFYAKKGLFKTLVNSTVDILAGVPTVVIGLAALVIFTMPQLAFLSILVEHDTGGMVTDSHDSAFDEWGDDWIFDDDDWIFDDADWEFDDFWGEWDEWDDWTEEAAEEVFEEEILTAAPANRAYGRSFLVAGITMAAMILPFVIKSMEESLKSVPKSYIDASLALGATKWRTIHKVVLPAARDGLLTGVILGMGRITGDTAIVWLTLGGGLRMTGNQPWFIPENWLSTLTSSGSTLTTYIYYTSPAGEGDQFDVAFGASIVLIAIIILLNITATLIGKAGGKKYGH